MMESNKEKISNLILLVRGNPLTIINLKVSQKSHNIKSVSQLKNNIFERK